MINIPKHFDVALKDENQVSKAEHEILATSKNL